MAVSKKGQIEFMLEETDRDRMHVVQNNGNPFNVPVVHRYHLLCYATKAPETVIRTIIVQKENFDGVTNPADAVEQAKKKFEQIFD